MNKFLIKMATVLVATMGASILSVVKAEAASLIEFSYDFDNSEFGSVTGTVEGDISENGTVENLSNVNAVYSAQPSVTFDRFSNNSSSPIFSVGTIEEETLFDKSVPYVLFALANESGDEFRVNSVITGQKAYLVSPDAGTFVQDVSEFGTWTAKVANGSSKDIPEPSVALGLMAMVGCLAPMFSNRRAR